MAHFAEVNTDKIVQRVIVVDNNDCRDTEGNESEAVGAAFCNTLLNGIWKQTSYNGNIRKNYAGIGYTYDEVRDAFIPPMPPNVIPAIDDDGNTKEVTWILNEDTCNWDMVE
jgi:hypothetical protein